jgi:hypothetical protein
MHELDFYPMVDPDSQMLHFFMHELRMKIKCCGAKQYSRVMYRLADRVLYWVKTLLNDGLIQHDAEGILEKSETFEKFWAKRLEIWNGQFKFASPVSTRESSPVAETSVSSVNMRSTADSGYWTGGGTSVMSAIGQRSVADFAYGITGKEKDLEFPGRPEISDSRWGEDVMWNDGLDRGMVEYPDSADLPVEDGSLRGGLNPYKREIINDIEIPSLKEQEQHRHLERKNLEIAE